MLCVDERTKNQIYDALKGKVIALWKTKKSFAVPKIR